jgi:signal transduction histidine kinase
LWYTLRPLIAGIRVSSDETPQNFVGPWGDPMGSWFRIPGTLWSRRGSAAVLASLIVPVGLAIVLAPGPATAGTLDVVRVIGVAAVSLVAAALLHLHGRLADNGQSAGVSVTLALAALAGLLSQWLPLLPGLPLAVVTLGVVLIGLHPQALPRWARARFGAAAALTTLSIVISASDSERVLDASVALVCGLVGGAAFATTAAALLRLVLAQQQQHVAQLRSRVSALEAEHRADRSRWHDVNTIVAGVSSASQLIADAPPSDHRDGLQTMVLDELGRLQRMLHERSPSAVPQARVDVDLDRLVARIALAHGGRGQEVSWVPSGLQVQARGDDVAEVLDILVENAAVHGRPDAITITAARTHDAVEIAVADGGPGVLPELRERIFDWGTRREGSPGHGIGLYSAVELARGLGGELRLDGGCPGARFVLRIPAALRREQVDLGAEVAHLTQ